jgi:uncharacterized integral membrane protein
MGPETVSTPHVDTSPAPERNRKGLPFSRVGRAWTALVPAGITLFVVLVFVLQNLQRSNVRFLIWSGGLPLGIALLISAALGALAVFLLGSVRIVQLRRMTRRRP